MRLGIGMCSRRKGSYNKTIITVTWFRKLSLKLAVKCGCVSELSAHIFHSETPPYRHSATKMNLLEIMRNFVAISEFSLAIISPITPLSRSLWIYTADKIRALPIEHGTHGTLQTSEAIFRAIDGTAFNPFPFSGNAIEQFEMFQFCNNNFE